MSLTEFIVDLEKPDSKLKTYFSNNNNLVASLKELDNVIGMRKVKSQILKQIKTFISSKAKGTYKDTDRKHCLLLGPPGCGKTTVGKILCKIWISIGFIGKDGKTNKKSNSFNKLQDDIIRKQKVEIKEYKEKVRTSLQTMNNMGRVTTLCKRTLNNVISIKKTEPNTELNTILPDITSMIKIIEESTKTIEQLNIHKTHDYKGMGIENDQYLQQSKAPIDLPFYVYNRNDVVSRYVGDTTHRCTKAMTDALDGVAYFDEAYNLCNDSTGLSDSYGRVALTTINQFMDEYADRLIVVFAGYKNEIYNNLFKTQRGLESRFTNKFEIERYTPEELTQIFIQRLKYSEWIIDNTPELNLLIKENFKMFEFQGRDMDTLAMYTKNVISEKIYDSVLDGENIPNKITDISYVKDAVEIFRENMINATPKPENDFERMVNLLRT